MLFRFFNAFVRRLSEGDFRNTAYLTWYYVYLYLFDFRNGTNFAGSHPPSQSQGTLGGTGNFPGHPRIIRFLLTSSGLSKQAGIIDIGHGSGIALFTAAQLGFGNLTGVEHGKVPYDISIRNLRERAHLIHGDAFSIDLSKFNAIFFFNPFGGEMAKRFFIHLPNSISHVFTINHDLIVEPLLREQGFIASVQYNHPVYANFRGIVWKR